MSYLNVTMSFNNFLYFFEQSIVPFIFYILLNVFVITTYLLDTFSFRLFAFL